MIVHDKINGFLATLLLLKDKVSRNRFALFPRLCDYLGDTDDIEMESLDSIDQFEHYFNELEVESFNVARDPFSARLDNIDDDDAAQEELVRLQEDLGAKSLFQSATLGSFSGAKCFNRTHIYRRRP